MVTFGCRMASRPMLVRSPITTRGPTTAPGPSRALAAITALGSTRGAGHGGGACGGEPRCEPAVGEKGERPRWRVLDRRHVDDLDPAVTAQLAAERARDLAELHALPLAERYGWRPTHLGARPVLGRCAPCALPMPPDPVGRPERSRARPPPVHHLGARPLLAR